MVIDFEKIAEAHLEDFKDINDAQAQWRDTPDHDR